MVRMVLKYFLLFLQKADYLIQRSTHMPTRSTLPYPELTSDDHRAHPSLRRPKTQNEYIQITIVWTACLMSLSSP